MQLAFDLDAEVVTLMKSKTVELPTYPGVALKLQQLISSGNFGLGELAKLVESDQSLAAAVLRAANSAFYAASAPITTLQQAISRVGANSLNNIAISASLGAQGSKDGPLSLLRKESWRRSLIGALLCQELGPKRNLARGEASLAGLLHDFGETIAYSCFERVLKAHPEVTPQSAASWKAEAQRYHVELGMALAVQWKLPDFVLEAVMRHHDTDFVGCQFQPLVELVATTDTVTNRLFESPTLEGVNLNEVPGLKLNETDLLQNVMQKVPAFLESFENPNVPQATGKAAPSLVEMPESTLTPDAKVVDFPMTVVAGSMRLPYRATAISDSTLRIWGAAPQSLWQLICLELKAGLHVSAMVQQCVSSSGGCTIELRPFAMNKTAQDEWARLAKS